MKNKKTLLLNFSKTYNIDFNVVLKYYAFERLLYRISKSKYKDILALKGGFFLFVYSNEFQRITRDIDFSLLNYDLTIYNVKKIIRDLLTIKTDDDMLFSLKNISLIKNNSEYYGLRIKLCFNVFGINDIIHIDLATGDVITPKPLKMKYNSFINKNHFIITSYSIETYMSEKLETIFNKLENNSRMKDFYDIYLIDKLYQNNINYSLLKKAINNTFRNRKYNNDIKEAINIIENSKILKQYWLMYKSKNDFAKDIEFKEITTIICKYTKYIKLNYKKASFGLSFV